jgi:hypothetical protein
VDFGNEPFQLVPLSIVDSAQPRLFHSRGLSIPSVVDQARRNVSAPQGIHAIMKSRNSAVLIKPPSVEKLHRRTAEVARESIEMELSVISHLIDRLMNPTDLTNPAQVQTDAVKGIEMVRYSISGHGLLSAEVKESIARRCDELEQRLMIELEK